MNTKLQFSEQCLFLKEKRKNTMSSEMTLSNSSNENDKLTFHNACAKGNLSVVKNYLAQQGFDMNDSDNEGRTGFHLACFTENLKCA